MLLLNIISKIIYYYYKSYYTECQDQIKSQTLNYSKKNRHPHRNAYCVKKQAMVECQVLYWACPRYTPERLSRVLVCQTSPTKATAAPVDVIVKIRVIHLCRDGYKFSKVAL